MIILPYLELKAVALFAGKKDIREYLNGVCVTSVDGALGLVATDGHRMTAFRDDGYEYDGDDFIIPNALIEAIPVPAKGRTDIEVVLGEGRQITIKTDARSASDLRIDGKYPNWKAVIPRKQTLAIFDDEGFAGFNAAYLATYAKMLKILGAAYINIAPNGRGPTLVDVGDKRFICIVMPARGELAKLPDWISFSSADDVAQKIPGDLLYEPLDQTAAEPA